MSNDKSQPGFMAFGPPVSDETRREIAKEQMRPPSDPLPVMEDVAEWMDDQYLWAKKSWYTDQAFHVPERHLIRFEQVLVRLKQTIAQLKCERREIAKEQMRPPTLDPLPVLREITAHFEGMIEAVESFVGVGPPALHIRGGGGTLENHREVLRRAQDSIAQLKKEQMRPPSDPLPVMAELIEALDNFYKERHAWPSKIFAARCRCCEIIAIIRRERGDTEAARHVATLKGGPKDA